MDTINNGISIWATHANQVLRNSTVFDDTFHAIFNNITMDGGGGADTFHIAAGTTGAIIENFDFGSGDIIKIDGLKCLNRYLFSVTMDQGNYVVAYGTPGDKNYTTFSFKQPIEDLTGKVWTVTPEEFEAHFVEKVAFGQEDPLGEYVTGFDSLASAQLATSSKQPSRTFKITGERPLYIEGFSAHRNRHNLSFDLPNNGDLHVGHDKRGIIYIRQGGKLLAELTAPVDTESLKTWAKNSINEIRSAAKQAGLQISNR